jgi:hypothetical protein
MIYDTASFCFDSIPKSLFKLVPDPSYHIGLLQHRTL